MIQVLFSLSLLLTVAYPTGPTGATATSSRYCAFPLGIADPEIGRAYLRDGNAVVAIRLGDGRIIWRFDGGILPIAITQNGLVVLTGAAPNRGLGVAVLQVDDGMILSPPKALHIPLSTAQLLRDAYSIPAVFVDGDALIVAVRSRGAYRGGANPPQRALPSETTNEYSAIVVIDPSSGEASVANPSRLANLAPAFAFLPIRHVEMAAAQNTSVVLDHVGQLSVRTVNGQSVVVLSGASPTKIPSQLNIGPLVEIVGLVELGSPQHYLMATVVQEPTSRATTMVISVDDLRSIGSVAGSFVPGSEPTIISNRLFGVTSEPSSEKLTLLAMDLSSGRPEWQLELDMPSSSRSPMLPQ